MVKKRERLEVIHDILVAVRDNGNSIKPTRLLYASNLSPQMFKEYCQELVDKGFMEIVEDRKGKKNYILTEKGFNFLSRYRVIVDFIEGFGL